METLCKWKHYSLIYSRNQNLGMLEIVEKEAKRTRVSCSAWNTVKENRECQELPFTKKKALQGRLILLWLILFTGPINFRLTPKGELKCCLIGPIKADKRGGEWFHVNPGRHCRSTHKLCIPPALPWPWAICRLRLPCPQPTNREDPDRLPEAGAIYKGMDAAAAAAAR